MQLKMAQQIHHGLSGRYSQEILALQICQKLVWEDRLRRGVHTHLLLPMPDHILSAVFSKHFQVSQYGLNLLGGVLNGQRFGGVLPLRLNSLRHSALASSSESTAHWMRSAGKALLTGRRGG